MGEWYCIVNIDIYFVNHYRVYLAIYIYIYIGKLHKKEKTITILQKQLEQSNQQSKYRWMNTLNVWTYGLIDEWSYEWKDRWTV